jgi:hypothetical protein
MTRSLNYTSESAATKFLEIVAELRLRPTGVAGPVVAASAP